MFMNKLMNLGTVHARTKLRLAWLCLLVLSALVLLAACGGGSTGAGTGTIPTTGTPSISTPVATPTQACNTQMVLITTDCSGSFAFTPSTITIKAGTTVTWKNATA